MYKFLICIGIILIGIILIATIVFLILRKISKEKEKKEDIFNDDIFNDDKIYKRPVGDYEQLFDLLNKHPELAQAMVEQNKKSVEKEAEEDSKYNFPIKRSVAISIANRGNTLKKDFCVNTDKKRYIIPFIPGLLYKSNRKGT